ncbi:Uncharacterised protein [uncultured archaeon]|nr:Uncharacterised protein [uncultured archaeon]
MKIKAFAALALGFILIATMLPASAVQIIVVNETAPQIYTLDEVTVSGDLSGNDLSFTGTGDVISGENVKVYLFGGGEDVLVRNVLVNRVQTPVAFDTKGFFFITNTTGPMKIQGELILRKPGQESVFVPGPINHLKFDLTGGYAVDGERFGAISETVVLQRSKTGARTVQGAFKFTYAERNTFQYRLDLTSYGEAFGTLNMPLINGETVQSVEGTGILDWKQEGKTLRIEISGDKTTVTIDGFFTNTDQLTVPLKDGRHHVIVESDPEKKITVSTAAKELDVSESPIPPSYGNARVFLAADNEFIKVSVKTLELAPSLAASVSDAQHIIAVTSEGSVLGNLVLSYANTGVDYLEMKNKGKPLYAATGSGPVKLTTDGGKLFLALPKQNYGSLDYLYFMSRDPLGFVDTIDVPGAETDMPETQRRTTVYMPKDFFVLWTEGAEGGSELPTAKEVVAFVVVVGLIAYAYRRSAVFTFAYIVAALGVAAFDGGIFLLMLLITVALIARRHMPKDERLKYVAAALVVLVVGFAAVIVLGGFLFAALGVFDGGTSPPVVYEKGLDYATVSQAPMPEALGRNIAMLSTGGKEGNIAVPIREGVLPVKLQLPSLGKQVSFTHYLVTSGKVPDVRVHILNRNAVYVLYLISLIAGAYAISTSRQHTQAKKHAG